jgi:ligand-binding SRPBCC domain-containing protein
MAVFETSVTLDSPPERVFDLLLLPATHLRLSPPDAGLNFTDFPPVLALGSRFEFRIQSWGTIQQIVHEVIEFDRPRGFTERQVRGPLKSWRHEHRFEPTASGQVVVTDRIEFEPPGGLVGLLVTESKILDKLEDGFFYRHGQLRQLLEATP